MTQNQELTPCENFDELMTMFMNRHSYEELKEQWGMALAQICINVNCIEALNLIANWLEPFGELVDNMKYYKTPITNLKN